MIIKTRVYLVFEWSLDPPQSGLCGTAVFWRDIELPGPPIVGWGLEFDHANDSTRNPIEATIEEVIWSVSRKLFIVWCCPIKESPHANPRPDAEMVADCAPYGFQLEGPSVPLIPG